MWHPGTSASVFLTLTAGTSGSKQNSAVRCQSSCLGLHQIAMVSKAPPHTHTLTHTRTHTRAHIRTLTELALLQANAGEVWLGELLTDPHYRLDTLKQDFKYTHTHTTHTLHTHTHTHTKNNHTQR